MKWLILVLIFGFSTIWSTAPALSVNQFTFILIALLFALLVSRINAHLFTALSWPAYFLALTGLLFTFFLGVASRGSIRWLEIGPFRLQTSELAKPLLILFFAQLFSQPINSPFLWLLKRLVFLLPPVLLILIQPDLGSALIVVLVWLGMLAFSEFPKRYLFLFTCVFVLTLPLAYNFLQPYQKERLSSFINPYGDPQGSGYNVIQAQVAIGSGRILGKGVRQGTQSHLKFLPERHTDFAFASFAEEFGFLGVSGLFTSFALILLRLLKIAHKTIDPQLRLVVLGAFFLFLFQILINLGMNLGLLPVTGITLPFFSYGGSSLLSFGIVVGLVASIHFAFPDQI